MDIEPKARRTFMREVQLLSDIKLFPEAESFVKDFLQDSEPISSAQINGLENVLSATHSIAAIGDYVLHQREKAARHADPNRKNRDFYLAHFYELLDRKFKELAGFIEEESACFPIPADASKKEHREWLRFYQYYLVKEFVQHLVADHNFRAVTM